jgi:hypothetical protein
VLELDKEKALEVFGEEAAKEIKLLDVNTTVMLNNVLDRIQNACGTAWQSYDPNPPTNPPTVAQIGYDCEATELGETFGPNWQTSDEFAMVRLLSMTPANASIQGSSLQEVAQAAYENPGLFQFDVIFAESLGIGETSPFVPTDQLVIALQQHLLATHPAIGGQGETMPITMYDALLDMAPLATKLGAVGAAPWDDPGEHPGVLVADDASFTTKSDALLPNFRMRVVAESNLRWVSGVDLSIGAGDMFLQEADAALTFDFNDSQKMQIEGVADNPTVDMRLAVNELPGVVPSCTDPPDPECRMNLPPPLGTPVGNGTVWTIQPFFLESIVGRSGLLTYGGRTFSECYFVFNGECQFGVDIGQGGDPSGWTVFTSNILIGQPPDPITPPVPQYIWELLTEVSQVALHDPTGDGVPDIPEGQATPIFALHGVPIGLTGPEIIAQMRPTLQSQSEFISDTILGRYWKNNDDLDFYYHRATPRGAPHLYFVDETDLRADPADPDTIKPYTYANPGFFTSPDLSPSSKVSAKVITGIDDTTHEKYQLPIGETVLYMQDDEGVLYEVTFFVPEGDPVLITADVERL